MQSLSILVIGGGIGGLTSAIALCREGYAVDVIEKDPTWSVYGVGIIQQGNVIRAMNDLGILDDYIEAGFGFDHVDVFIPTGQQVPTSASDARPCTRSSGIGPRLPVPVSASGSRRLAWMTMAKVSMSLSATGPRVAMIW